MNTKQGLKILKEEGIFWSRLGFSIDPPQFDDDNNNILNEDPERYFKYHRDMAKAGIKVHTCIIPSGWVSSGNYDFKTTMAILDRLMDENTDIYFMPRIKFNPPISWLKENPSEVFVYENGPETEEEIAALVGTEKHNTIGDGRDGVLISNQSLSSVKWQSAAKEYLAKLIDIIENREYSERIIGYHLGYGICGETHMWGDVRTLDFGIGEKKRFFEYGIKKYSDVENLKKNWNMPDVSEKNVPIPKECDRFDTVSSARDFFHGSDEYMSYIDYNFYRKESSFMTIENFAKLVKEKTNKVVGFFHGYVLTGGADRHGHTDLEYVLDSPYIDFICAPKSYYRNALGEPGGYYAPPLSVNMKKLWIDEMDYPNNEGKTDDFIKILWREFAKDMSMDTPFWWMDLLGSWYDYDDVQKTVSELVTLKKSFPKNRESIAEILLITDENAWMYTTPNYTLCTKLIQETQAQVALSGMPYDMYRIADIENIDLKRYKVIFFLDCFEIPEKTRETVFKNIKSGTTVIFNYASGIISDGFSIDNVKKNTGFELKERGEKCSMPYFEIVQKDSIKPIYSFLDMVEAEENSSNCVLTDIPKIDAIAVAELTRADGGKNIMAAVPALKSNFIRRTAENAGCSIYAPLNTTLYGDSRFLGIFAHGDVNESLRLDGRYFDAVKKEYVSDEIVLNMKNGDFAFLINAEQ